MKNRLFLSALVLLAMTIFTAAAQDTPENINLALADLSVRVGQPVTLNDLQNWTFEQQVFPDSSLGCPQPGQVYSQVQTVAVKYVLTYRDVTYDYRVSDSGVVILCNEAEAVPPCPPPDVTGYLPPRLIIGGQGRVGVGGIPNNVRELPGSSSRLLGEIPSEAVFTVLDGPNCTTLDKVVWWQVDYNGLVGWTAESKDGEYFLEPIVLPGTIVPTAPPQQLATATPIGEAPVLNAGNAAEVGLISNPTVENGVYDLTPDGLMMAVGQADGSIVIYDLDTNTASPPAPAHNGAVTAVIFDINPTVFQYVVITAGSDSLVRIWELGQGNTLIPILDLMGIEGAVTTIAYSSVGQLVAVGDDRGSVYLFDINGAAPLTTLTGHTAAITELTFSGSGKTILSVDASGSARVWGIPVAVG